MSGSMVTMDLETGVWLATMEAVGDLDATNVVQGAIEEIEV